jgi:hypothetical protein
LEKEAQMLCHRGSNRLLGERALGRAAGFITLCLVTSVAARTAHAQLQGPMHPTQTTDPDQQPAEAVPAPQPQPEQQPQRPPPPQITQPTWLRDISAGFGAADFAGSAASLLTKIGVAWDVRLGLSPLPIWPVELEIGYVGTDHPSNNVLGPFMSGGSIMSNGLEGVAKLRVRFRSILEPYGFAGVGWDHWGLSGAGQFDSRAIRGSDNTVVIPWGGGARVDLAHNWNVDGRFTYRSQLLDDLLLTSGAGVPDQGPRSLGNWTLAGRVGYAF